jgi:hypothetical protein
MPQPERDQIVTYYPAQDEFGALEEDNTPRAAQVVELHKGKGLTAGMVTLLISGTLAGRGPFKRKAAVPPFTGPEGASRRGMYDLSRTFERYQGELPDDAFEEAEEERPPTPTELAQLVARQAGELAALKRRIADLESAPSPSVGSAPELEREVDEASGRHRVRVKGTKKWGPWERLAVTAPVPTGEQPPAGESGEGTEGAAAPGDRRE